MYANETNSIVGTDYHQNFNAEGVVKWNLPGLEITRLRLLTDPGFPVWDVSYCHGVYNGQDVRVSLPFSQIPKRYRGGIAGFIIDQAKEDGVYAKGTGILDVISKLW